MKTTIERKNINWENIKKLPTANDMLDDLYGKEGTVQRESFKNEAYLYYYDSINKADKQTIEECEYV